LHSQTSFILVHLVEKRSVGERFLRKRAEWPLHITLAPWFYVDSWKEATLLEAIKACVQSKHRFQAEVGEELLFTSSGDKNVAVNVMADQLPFKDMQTDLLDIVRQYYDSFHAAEPYIEDAFTAHITHHEHMGTVHRRVSGDVEDIDNVTVLRLISARPTDYCEVVAHFSLPD
jgi:2'-5' RNA ligase